MRAYMHRQEKKSDAKMKGMSCTYYTRTCTWVLGQDERQNGVGGLNAETQQPMFASSLTASLSQSNTTANVTPL